MCVYYVWILPHTSQDCQEGTPQEPLRIVTLVPLIHFLGGMFLFQWDDWHSFWTMFSSVVYESSSGFWVLDLRVVDSGAVRMACDHPVSSPAAPGHFPCHSIKGVSIMTNLLCSKYLPSEGAERHYFKIEMPRRKLFLFFLLWHVPLEYVHVAQTPSTQFLMASVTLHFCKVSLQSSDEKRSRKICGYFRV